MKKEDKSVEFEAKIEQIFPEDYVEIVKHLKVERPKTFRINKLVVTEEEALNDLKSEGYSFVKSEIDDGFIFTKAPEDKTLASSKAFNENKIYIQELSSLLPVAILDPKPNEKILDFCASPGSKTGLIAIKTNDSAEIIAIEKGRDRFFKMKELLKNQNVQSVKCYLQDANTFPKRYPEFLEYFDKVLVDAPCTNEGSIDLSHPSTLKYWSQKEAKMLSKLQKGLLNNALKLLKPGGILVYSTCTFSVEENEAVVDWALKRWPKVELQDIEININNRRPGRVEWNGKSFASSLSKTIRIIPNENWSGFFLAKLKKN